jgi:hypothetical protein
MDCSWSNDVMHESVESKAPTVCRKQCGGHMRLSCYISMASRVAVIPLVWWGIIGFGSGSGTDLLRDRLGLGMDSAAALMALGLAAVSACSLVPCRIHKRIMSKRRVRLKCPEGRCPMRKK